MKTRVIFLVVGILLTLLIPSTAFANGGCCSWHDGLDYCDEKVGKWVCKDGTYSPSCTCSKRDNAGIVDYDDIYNTNDDSEDSFNKNAIFSIIIMLISYGLIGKLKINKKDSSLSKIFNILIWILLLTTGWIVIPFVLGLYGHYFLEVISILIIHIIDECSS